jgi:hypothetical protein
MSGHEQIGEQSTMKIPSFEALKLQPAGELHSYAKHMHPNPRYYKYLWWVFWRGSPCDGDAFLADAHSLCTADAMALMDQLTAARESHWIYNRALPRDDPGVAPFDRKSLKWKNAKFAPSFAQDADPEWQGFR